MDIEAKTRLSRPTCRFPVDSSPGRVTALGFMVLDGRRLENRLQPARAGVASACSGKAKWKSQLSLLRAGGSDYPMNLLARAGVDLSQPDTVRAVAAELDTLVTRLETELDHG